VYNPNANKLIIGILVVEISMASKCVVEDQKLNMPEYEKPVRSQAFA